MKKYLVKFDYGYVSEISTRTFSWSGKKTLLSENEKDKAVENMKHYNFNYEVIEIVVK